MRKILWFLVGVSIATTVWFVQANKPAVRDVEAFAVMSCNQIIMVAFINSKHEMDGVGIDNAKDIAAVWPRVERVPKERRYYFNVAKHCPYTKRRQM